MNRDRITILQNRAIRALLAVATAANHAAEDSEDVGRDYVKLCAKSSEALEKALDELEDLPNDKPGYTLGPSSKAEWALRGLLEEQTSGDTGHEIIEKALQKAALIDPKNSPFPMSGEFARAYQLGLRDAYRHALEMIPAPKD